MVVGLARNNCFLEPATRSKSAGALAVACLTAMRVAIFRLNRYAAPQQTWTRKRFRVALPAADPPDNHKKTVHLHADLAQAAGPVSDKIS